MDEPKAPLAPHYVFSRWAIEMRVLRRALDRTAAILPKDATPEQQQFLEMASRSLEDARTYLMLLSESLKP
jgi:hypothetical protein